MKLLLDSHIPAATVNALRSCQSGLDVQHLAKWQSGEWLEAEDADILAACAEEGRVWVTYDLSTVPVLLTELAGEGKDHAGVFLVDDKTISPKNIGALAAALSYLVDDIAGGDTLNLVRYVQKARR